jgi:hypothetical protein
MHIHHRSRNATHIVVSGSLVGGVVMLVVAVVMWVMGAIFFVVAQSSRLLYTPFTITAVGLCALGVLMVVIGIVMLRKRPNAEAQIVEKARRESHRP